MRSATAVASDFVAVDEQLRRARVQVRTLGIRKIALIAELSDALENDAIEATEALPTQGNQ